MSKKAVIVLIAGILIALVFGLRTMRAEKYSDANNEADRSDFPENLTKIETKIDKLSSGLDGNNKDILNKLNTILSNQEKMFQELETIKVRSTRR
ncbi:MAG: hypothetical protein V2A64_03130 [Candidatus Omnitrophota bacterium]